MSINKAEPTMEQWGRYMRELRDTGHLTEYGRGFLAGVEAHERSAGAAAAIDVLREAFSDFDPCHECDNAEKAWAALARLASEGTDR